MNLINILNKNDGTFDIEDFYDHMDKYERAFKLLLKNNHELAYKCLKHYFEEFKKIEKEPFYSYRPGMDYLVSFYSIYQYALLEKNKIDKEHAYLILLKRFGKLSPSIQKRIIDKKHILLKHAFPDLNDLYSISLYEVGEYLYRKKRYKEAFSFYKKGANFIDDGRQIEYPFYLIARNQDKVGDMYRYGKGVKKNILLARRYYQKCAINSGIEYHPKMGDFEYVKGNYEKAFLYYTNGFDSYSRYDQSFLEPSNLEIKYKKIYSILNSIPLEMRRPISNLVLAVMHYYGYGDAPIDIEKCKELLSKSSNETWAINKYSLEF